MLSICRRCEKPVYLAELILANGQKWHKVCFKCNQCNKPLDSTNINSHKMEIWCQHCYRRKFGLKGYSFCDDDNLPSIGKNTDTNKDQAKRITD